MNPPIRLRRATNWYAERGWRWTCTTCRPGARRTGFCKDKIRTRDAGPSWDRAMAGAVRHYWEYHAPDNPHRFHS